MLLYREVITLSLISLVGGEGETPPMSAVKSASIR
jgi:hypothetical protein